MADRFQWLKSFFTNNRSLKLLAIVLAVLSYYAIRSETRFEVHYDIPLEVKVGEGIAILDQNPRTVDVTFRGSQEDLRRLDQKMIKAVVQPRASDPAGFESVSIDQGNIEGVSGVRVVRIKPSIVTLTFDYEDEKKVPVAKPETIGTPRIGKAEIEYDPHFVNIRGPRQRLKDKKIVFTEQVNVDGCEESFSKQVQILSSGDTWVSQIDPSEIMVKVNIVTESVSREWTNITVLALVEQGGGSNLTFKPETVNVSLHGRAEILESISNGSIRVFVDCVGLEKSAKLPVDVHLPAGVDVDATVEPEKVKVEFGRY